MFSYKGLATVHIQGTSHTGQLYISEGAGEVELTMRGVSFPGGQLDISIEIEDTEIVYSGMWGGGVNTTKGNWHTRTVGKQLADPPELTFSELAEICAKRSDEWGDPGLEFRAIEMGGEAGECLDAVKKYLRHNLGMVGGNSDITPIAEELADVVISATNIANDLDIDLGEAVREKFNETSKKYCLETRLIA